MTEQMERERMVLGGMMVDGYDMRDVIRELNLGWANFSVEGLLIYAAIVRLHLRRMPIDQVTVVEELLKRDELDLAGGPHGIAEIAGAYVGYELRR